MNSSASSDPSRAFFAPHALLPTGWARDVLLEWNEGGELVAVTPGVGAPADVASAAGAVVPGMPNTVTDTASADTRPVSAAR